MTTWGGEQPSIEIRTAYCSACDRNVRVVFAPRAGDTRGPPDVSDLVCLEYGETCTGDMCPLFGVPSEAMRDNLKLLLEETEPPAGS